MRGLLTVLFPGALLLYFDKLLTMMRFVLSLWILPFFCETIANAAPLAVRTRKMELNGRLEGEQNQYPKEPKKATKRRRPDEGPYYLIPDRAEECPRNEMALDCPLKVKLVRERDNPHYFFLTMHWASQFMFDDTKDARIVMASWSSRGGWKENALIMKFRKLCTAVKTYVPEFWKEIVAHMQSNLTSFQHDCPFPPGAFSIQNLSTSTLQPKGIPHLFYGKWKIDAKAVEPSDDRVLGCFRFYASVIPKSAQKGRG